ncbi:MULTISPECIES: site-specific integrase [Vibrio]|uniref:site-specific integrase n=1 Tax=Vibrio TaxID=662 RepID=UPI000C858CF6|nr:MULTISPECIES: site-specific integrase [Vibrio]
MDFMINKVNVNGVQQVFFVDELGLPITDNITINWANNYICKEKEHNTIRSRETESAHLLFSLKYFITNGIDVTRRVESGRYITFNEVLDFSTHCFKKAKVIQQQTSSKVVSFSTKDFLSPALKSMTFEAEKVANGTAAARMLSMKSFIEYLHKRIHTSFTDTDTVLNYKNTMRNLSLEIKKAKTENKKVIDIDKPIFDEEVLEALFDMIQVGHPENPFKSGQIRNRIIIDTIFDTGIRRGALLQTKITDLRDENIERIVIENRVNRDDIRQHRPTQKSQSGQVAIEPEIMLNIKKYIEEERVKYPMSENHDFILISEWGTTAGQPLSITGFNYIFEVLSKAISKKLGRKVTIGAHQIRHHWNQKFSEDTEAAGLSNTETDRLRKDQMTWSAKSEMAEVYNVRHSLKKVRDIKQRYQNKMYFGD